MKASCTTQYIVTYIQSTYRYTSALQLYLVTSYQITRLNPDRSNISLNPIIVSQPLLNSHRFDASWITLSTWNSLEEDVTNRLITPYGKERRVRRGLENRQEHRYANGATGEQGDRSIPRLEASQTISRFFTRENYEWRARPCVSRPPVPFSLFPAFRSFFATPLNKRSQASSYSGSFVRAYDLHYVKLALCKYGHTYAFGSCQTNRQPALRR